MNIKMIGVDYTSLSLSKREPFSLTKEAAKALGHAIIDADKANGIVVLSTCNRTEIWVDGFEGDLEEAFFAHRNEENRCVFTHREGDEAIHYLFELSCGMHSQIFGEDQILTQVKNAASLARESGFSCSTLETLFRLAVTSAKAIKTEVVLTDKDASVPACAVKMAKNRLGSLEGKKCLVIGNGEMGKLAAGLLVDCGCEVTVTIRTYHRGAVLIPQGCRAVMYDERYKTMSEMDAVFSATLSPHHTVKVEELAQHGYRAGVLFFDLALPRDIEEGVGALPDTILVDIDGLEANTQRDEETLNKAYEIIEKYKVEFSAWRAKRAGAGDAKIVGSIVSEFCQQKIRGTVCEKEQMDEKLLELIGGCVQKSVEKLMFSARESMDDAHWRETVLHLRKTAEEIMV